MTLDTPIPYQSNEQEVVEAFNEASSPLKEDSNPTSIEEYINEITSLQTKIFNLLNGPNKYCQTSVSSQLADVSSWLINQNKTIDDAQVTLEKARNILATLRRQ